MKIVRHTVKYLTNKLFLPFGMEVYPKWYLPHLPFVTHLREIFNRLNIDCVLDVGANKGQYAKFLRQEVGYEGLIISFEPVKKNYLTLCEEHKVDKNIIKENYALGSENRKDIINVALSDDLSSFLEPDMDDFKIYTKGKETEYKEEVYIKKLDEIYLKIRKKYGIKRPYLKMDTQGFDLEVARGAKNTLKEILALQTEVSLLPLYKAMPDYIETIRHFNDDGFSITGLFPVNRDECMRVIEFDCVMINNQKVENKNLNV